MSLRKTYLLWFIAWVLSSFIGAGAFLAAMHHSYGNFSGKEDFDGLPYFLGAIILIVFLTGWVSAYLIHLSNRKKRSLDADSVARNLVGFHSTITSLAILSFPLGFLYFNIIGFLLFFTLPIFSWHAAQNKNDRKKWIKIFIGILIAIVLYEAIIFYSVISSDPFKA